MFSPDASAQPRLNASIRNPRRRRRHGSDGLRQPRKRSKISEDTFVANGDVDTTGNGDGRDSPSLLQAVMPVREKRERRVISSSGQRTVSSSWRPAKNDGSSVLSKTDEYVISALPGLPERLRNDATGSFRAFFQSSPSSHHIIVTTRDAALIWDYNTATTSPVPRSLSLPQPLRHSDRLPIASLVTTSASSDIGLVIIYPSNGLVTFWENIDSAESTSLFQRSRQGIEGSVKLLSGESVEECLDIEHAGYILTLSSGRLVHLTVRDSQGRAAITAAQLSSDAHNKSGRLGSWYQTLVGGWRNTIESVQARPSHTRGQMEVVAVTAEGSFKFWDVNWTGQSAFTAQIDASQEIRDALVVAQLAEANGKANIKVIDFAILSGSDVSTRASQPGLNVLVLAAVEDTVTRFALLQFALIGGSIVQLKRNIPINVFYTTSKHETSTVQLLVPQPEHTAYIVSSLTVVVASLADVASSVIPFQDIIYLDEGKGARVVSVDSETPPPHSRSESSSILLFTKAAGAVRISANKPSSDPTKQKVSPKSKIEQAIFFGTRADNFLDLGNIEGLAFPTKDLEFAAMQISQDVLKSATPFIPTQTSSMEQQLTSRINAHRSLVVYLKNHCQMSRLTKWTLMWDAERVACGRAIWRAHENELKARAQAGQSLEMVLDLAVVMIPEKLRHQQDSPGSGEKDNIRTWLTYDLSTIPRLLAHIPGATRELLYEQDQGGKNIALLTNMREGKDIILAALETPYIFRTENLNVYGLEDEPMEDGVLQTGYGVFPDEVWTGRANTTNCIDLFINFFHGTCIKLSDMYKGDSANQLLVGNLVDEHCRAVALSCKSHFEGYSWLLSRGDEQHRKQGEELKCDFEDKIRHKQLMGLADLGRARDGMKIAEKFNDMESLVALALDDLEFNGDPASLKEMSKKQQQTALAQLGVVTGDIERYFTTYGIAFAKPFFTAEIEKHKFSDLLQQKFGTDAQRTEFLRSNPQYAKISWINDITAEKDYVHAAESLLDVAKKQENNAWAKKTQLSISKLALMASQNEATGANGRASPTHFRRNSQVSPREHVIDDLMNAKNRENVLVSIQNQLYAHFKPTITSAVDFEGAEEMIMATFGASTKSDRDHLNALLNTGFQQIMKHQVLQPDLLIDVLTLMDSVYDDTNPDNVYGMEFLLALKVLDASGVCDKQDSTYGEMLLRLIWKRLLIRDDWTSINNTKGKSDSQIQEALMSTALFQTLKLGTVETLWSTTPAFTMPTPTNVLHAGSSPKDLATRFSTTDLASALAADNALDDKKLNNYLSLAKLTNHFNACKSLAFESVEKDSEEQGDQEEGFRSFVGSWKEPSEDRDEVLSDEDLESDFEIGADERLSEGRSLSRGGSVSQSEDEEMFRPSVEMYASERSSSYETEGGQVFEEGADEGYEDEGAAEYEEGAEEEDYEGEGEGEQYEEGTEVTEEGSYEEEDEDMMDEA